MKREKGKEKEYQKKKHNQNKNDGAFSVLPNEIILHIIGYLSPKWLNEVARLNWHFREISTDKKTQASAIYYYLKDQQPQQLKKIKNLAWSLIEKSDSKSDPKLEPYKKKEILAELGLTIEGITIKYINNHLRNFRDFFLNLRRTLNHPSYIIVPVQNNKQNKNINCSDNDSLLCFYTLLPPSFLLIGIVGCFVTMFTGNWFLFNVFLSLTLISTCCSAYSFFIGLLLMTLTENLLNCLAKCCKPKITYQYITKYANSEKMWEEFHCKLENNLSSENDLKLGNHLSNFFKERNFDDVNKHTLSEKTSLMSNQHKDYQSLTRI